MKPQLDEMTDRVVASLSGKAKEFYDREFGFFNEVTSISGKLKPYIKKEKSEKKVTNDRVRLRTGGSLNSADTRLRSTRKWRRSSFTLESTSRVTQMARLSISTGSLGARCRVMPR